jgi:hypothetical protein
MYQEPKLERYGTFREVTQGGGADVNDPFTLDPDDDCTVLETDPVTGEDIILCVGS